MLVNVCRVCGRSRLCPKAVNIFKPGRQEMEVLRRIHLITGIRLQQIPKAPDMVCFCCQMDINSAMHFRRTCISEQKKWVPSEKAEEFDENQKEEPMDPLPKKRKYTRRRARSTMPVETVDIVVADENIPFPEATGGDEEFDQLAEISREPESTDGDPKLEDDDTKLDDDDAKIEEFEVKEEEFLLMDDEDTDSECKLTGKVQIFACNTCGVIKTNKSSLIRHKYDHTGKRPYPCKECSKTFLSGNELKAHNLTHHTKDPPFPCRYCERRYFSVVGRKKHERIHTNERPFVCDQCGKTFTRTCILKAHMESHTALKKFSCAICDRSFSLKKHLVTHFTSSKHKRNAEMAGSLSSESLSTVNMETDETWSESTKLSSSVDEKLVQSQFDILCQEI
ncbi:transcription factor Ouib [Drosophila rhopaloa]|uniref:Transcription factor Ouib n=1 Tax=Drosophila rhopaloa TaxID=1041015 RepID=A0A6P4EUN6_DRORH|nr:transcription factor Ouib [Drosophila rhopaloa]